MNAWTDALFSLAALLIMVASLKVSVEYAEKTSHSCSIKKMWYFLLCAMYTLLTIAGIVFLTMQANYYLGLLVPRFEEDESGLILIFALISFFLLNLAGNHRASVRKIYLA